MKYFHLESADTSNVLCIGFCTPNSNSKGIPHILEHTTLCGSHEFPVRDPFFHMLRRSLSSFMNAMTGMDYTIFPFRTVNETDFKNLLRVYLDSTFHPLLRELDFTQEGHRLVLQDEKVSIQGVVYNEMKGALAEPGRYFFSQLIKNALPGTPYEHISGGDPLSIPDLTYAELKAFHQKHYSAANATLITYGDMDARSHMQSINSIIKDVPEGQSAVTIPELDSKQLSVLFAGSSPRHVEIQGPADPVSSVDSSESTRIILTWVLPKESVRIQPINGTDEEQKSIARGAVYLEVLSTLLIDGPASPMYKALIRSGLGSDYCPGVGFSPEPKNPLFSFGVQGAKRDIVKAEEVTKIILKTIERAIDEGFPIDRVRGIVHQAVLGKRHRGGKFGLNLTLGCVSTSVQGFDIFEQLATTAYYDEILKGFDTDPKFFSNLMQSIFIDQSPKVSLTQHADPEHHEKLKKLEADRVQLVSESLTEERKSAITTQNAALEAFQKEEPKIECLPSLSRSEIPTSVIPELTGTVQNIGLNSNEVIVCPTNQVIYSNVFIPLSIADFTRRELLLLPTYTSLLCDLGTNALDNEALSTLTELLCSGFKSDVHLAANAEVTELIFGVHIRFHSLPEKYRQAMELLTKVLNEAKFDETDEKVYNRVQTVLLASAMSLTESVPSSGHQFALASALCKACPSLEILNTISGLEQVNFQNTIRSKLSANSESNTAENRKTSLVAEVIQEFAVIHKKVMQYRFQCWSVCEENDRSMCEEATRQQLEAIVKSNIAHPKASLSLVGHNPLSSEKTGDLYSTLAEVTPTNSLVSNSGEVAYVGAVFPTTLPMTHPDAALLQLALRVLSHELLHPEIREKGGAYGAGATASPGGTPIGLTGMFSYRDPSPLRSVQIFKDTWKFFSKAENILDRHINEGLLSIFSSLDAPRIPKIHGCRKYLYKMTDHARQRYREQLLSASRETILEKLPEILKKYSPSIVILGDEKLIESEKDAWKKVDF